MRMLASLTAIVALGMGPVDASDYVVVSLVDQTDPYHDAAEKLGELRGAKITYGQPGEIDKLLPVLKKETPRHVGFVVRPTDFDVKLARSVLSLSTQIDDDPFVDFAYGFVTGLSAERAVKLVEAGKNRKPVSAPLLTMVGVASQQMGKSRTFDQVLPLRGSTLRQTYHMISASDDAASGNVDPDQLSARDDEFLSSLMPSLDRKPLLVFAGHGYPREVIGGPSYKHLQGRDFSGAIALNIACYTGVTHGWTHVDGTAKTIAPEESFCLNMLDTGVAGYVAYACPRPAGPTMLGEAVTLATAGETMGQARQRRYNQVILSHLQLGNAGLYLPPDNDSKQPRRDVQKLLTAMSSGGILFGDPAIVAFSPSAEHHPVETSVKLSGNRLAVRVKVHGMLWHYFCSDQITMWNKNEPAMKVETVVDLPSGHVDVAEVTSNTFGKQSRLIAAVDQLGASRKLYLKANFPRPSQEDLMNIGRSGVEVEFEIKLTDDQRSPVYRNRTF